jgi:hypothetical protein
MRALRLALFLLLALVARVGAQPSSDARTIALAPYGPAPMRTVKVTVAGATYDFLFDTGGGVTVVSPEIAAKLGCVAQGRTRGHRMFGEYLESPICRDVPLSVEGHATRAEVAVMELKPYGAMPVAPVHGVISLHTFAGRALTLDLANARLVVESPASLRRRVRALTPLRARLATGMNGGHLTAFVAVPAGDAELWMLWDSGNHATTFVAPFSAAALGLADTTPDRARAVAALTLAPGLAVRTTVQSKRIVRDGVLGAALLARAVWTVDLADGRMWVGPVAPLLEPPTAVATTPVAPPRTDPTGWYDIALVVGAERQAAVLRIDRAGDALAARLRFLGEESAIALRDVRARGDSLSFELPMRSTYPVRLAFRDTAGSGTWGDPATRGGAVEIVKRN